MRLAGRFAGGCFAGGGLLRRLLLRRGRATPQVVASRVAGCSAVCCFAGGGRNVRSIVTLIVIFLAQPALGSQASVPGCFFCANDLCLLAFSFWRPADLLLCICCIATASAERQALPLRLPLRSIPPAAPPAGNIFPMALRHSASILFTMALPASSSATAPRPATSSRWLSAAAPPASNKPHPAEKSTPVWLAIWRTWAGFANSQHRDAALAISNNICAHSSLLPHWAAAQTDANLSTHLHRLPTPPPYLRQMRLSPGRGAGVGWQMLLLVVGGAVPANHRARESLF